MRFTLALGVAALCVGVAGAAELPTKLRDPKREPPKARACEIGGGQGVLLANGTCVRISGYVSAGATAGNLKH